MGCGGLEKFGIDTRNLAPLMPVVRTTTPAAVDDRPVSARVCGACGHLRRIELIGCECGVHPLCGQCVRDLCDGTVLVLGAEPPVRAKVCPDAAILARELMS